MRANSACSWLRLPGLPESRGGFTLLEVIIAITIMVMAFASILAVESNSINATTRAKEMNMVAMLAHGKMIDLEYRVEGKSFDEVQKEQGGNFDAPYEKFRWKTEIKEIKFPNMSMGNNKGAGNANGEDSGNQYADLIMKLVTNFFTKAIRELVVTVFWKRNSVEVSYTVSTYWVDLNHEFETSE
jgi:prepilin-type N-terminal cleavage/methylation domain-containing protein